MASGPAPGLIRESTGRTKVRRCRHGTILRWQGSPGTGQSTRSRAQLATSGSRGVHAMSDGFGDLVQGRVGQDERVADSLVSSLIRSGKRRPGSTCTAKISCTASSNRRKATIWPVRMSTTQTPQVRSVEPLGDRDAAEDRPSRAPARGRRRRAAEEVQPAREAGQLGDRLVAARRGSTKPSCPVPDSSSQSRPSCQRGEWGIDRPRSERPRRWARR